MHGPLLRVEGVRCARDGRTLFADLNFVVESGSCVALTGANGSGKSTLLRCITGLYPDFEGTIEAVPFVYLGHKPGLNGLLTAQENLRWYGAMDLESDAHRSIPQRLADVGLPGYADVPCRQMSAGQQRRVALARLLDERRTLWLLDEPYTALDTAGITLVDRLITQHVNRGGGVLCATHQGLSVNGVQALHLGQPLGQEG